MPSKKKFAVRIADKQLWTAALLTCAMAVSMSAMAQQSSQKDGTLNSPVVAVTYDLERAKSASSSGGGFWLQGGGLDVAVPFYKGLGIAASFSGTHASNIHPGVNLGEMRYLAGPRYTFECAHLNSMAGGANVQIFGEGLFGGVHGFDSIFPANVGVTPTANAFAMQLGGGLDIGLHHGFGVRALEVDYVRTSLPNNGINSQNDLRLAFGLSYHFNRK